MCGEYLNAERIINAQLVIMERLSTCVIIKNSEAIVEYLKGNFRSIFKQQMNSYTNVHETETTMKLKRVTL